MNEKVVTVGIWRETASIHYNKLMVPVLETIHFKNLILNYNKK